MAKKLPHRPRKYPDDIEFTTIRISRENSQLLRDIDLALSLNNKQQAKKLIEDKLTMKLLLVKIELIDNGIKFYGQTEDGAIPEGCIAYPDNNGDNCLIEIENVINNKGIEAHIEEYKLQEIDLWYSDKMRDYLVRIGMNLINTRWFYQNYDAFKVSA